MHAPATQSDKAWTHQMLRWRPGSVMLTLKDNPYLYLLCAKDHVKNIQYCSNLAFLDKPFSQAQDRHFCFQPLSFMWCFSEMYQNPSDSTVGHICSHLMTLLLRVLLSREHLIPEITRANLPSHVCTHQPNLKIKIKTHQLSHSRTLSPPLEPACAFEPHLWKTNLLQFNKRKDWKESESGGCLSPMFQDFVKILH